MTSNEAFELIGDLFLKDTRLLRPGKSYPLEMPRPENLDEIFQTWCREHQTTVNTVYSFVSPEKPGPLHKVIVSVLITQGYHLLLGKRPVNSHLAGWYTTPGGKIEVGEKALTASRREVLEETGLMIRRPIELIHFAEHFRFDSQYYVLYFHAALYSGELVNREPEKCEEWEWFNLHEIPSPCTEPQLVIEMLKERLK